MIKNGTLIVVSLPEVPRLRDASDDLSGMNNDYFLGQYFRRITNAISENSAFASLAIDSNLHTIVVTEKGFFVNQSEQEVFKKRLVELGVPSDHVLFGEHFRSG